MFYTKYPDFFIYKNSGIHLKKTELTMTSQERIFTGWVNVQYAISEGIEIYNILTRDHAVELRNLILKNLSDSKIKPFELNINKMKNIDNMYSIKFFLDTISNETSLYIDRLLLKYMFENSTIFRQQELISFLSKIALGALNKQTIFIRNLIDFLTDIYSGIIDTVNISIYSSDVASENLIPQCSLLLLLLQKFYPEKFETFFPNGVMTEIELLENQF